MYYKLMHNYNSENEGEKVSDKKQKMVNDGSFTFISNNLCNSMWQ